MSQTPLSAVDPQNTAKDAAPTELDARNLNCPLPILKTRKALASMETGDTLRLLATDPGATADMASFCRQTGHTLLSSRDEDGTLEFIIQKS
ncbi:MAG: sulfurtransferase TusA family protein [Parvularcula sp.]